ncbi:MAG: hypothetical protein ACJZ2G_06650 [Thalassobaculaceae bacterium]
MKQIVNRDHGMTGENIIGELTYMIRQEEKPYFESSMSTGGEPKIFFSDRKMSNCYWRYEKYIKIPIH